MAANGFQTCDREFKRIPIDLIQSSETPSREVFEGIKRLADTIREYGLLEPLIVQKRPDQTFIVVCGERRLRGCRQAGLQRVPCMILDGVRADQLFQMQLVENLQRADLTPYEEIKLIALLRNEFSLSQRSIARKIGVGHSTIYDYLLIAQALPEAVMRKITRTRGGHGRPKELTLSKAVILAKAQLSPGRLRKIVQQIERTGLNTKQLAALVAGTQQTRIQRVTSARVFWRELTKDLKTYARYWSEYATLTQNETVSEYRLTLEVRLPKDLQASEAPEAQETLGADEAPQVCATCGTDILEGDTFTEEDGFYYRRCCRRPRSDG